ncbi:hypothetical protein NKOR_05440 [Candidatus Nitrosopumilus koreensis AR1]|uniref:GOLD domain-containing protein n=1 Tax=Candidatus Nitrosopumilus koreensis AR1 TaxID=1229908 RepID=K0B690_9ARCH|nr:hypothetical protein NKOR_05440 [Candidatus Nitrosopumilus koreensis AR1]
MGLGAHVAALLVFGVVLTLFGISINGDLANIFSETDPVFFLLSVFILSLFVILKLKTKIQLEINSKVLTAFLCMVLLSSTFTGFANFSIAPETFAEEITNSTATATEVPEYSEYETTIAHEPIEVGENVVWNFNVSYDSLQESVAISLPDDAQIKNISINDSQNVLFDSSQIDSHLLVTEDDVLTYNVTGIHIYSPIEGQSEILVDGDATFVVTPDGVYSLVIIENPELIQEGHNFNHLVIMNSSSDYSIIFETPVAETQEETTVSDSEFTKDVKVSHDSGLHYSDVRTCSDLPEEYVEMGVEFQLFWNIDGEKVDVTDDPRFNLSYEDSDENGINDQMCWTVPQLSEQQFSIVANINVINVQSYPTVGGYWTVRFDTLGTADLTVTGFNGTTFGNSLPDDLSFTSLTAGVDSFTPEISGNSLIFRDYSSDSQGILNNLVMTKGEHNLKFTFGNDVDYAYNDASENEALDVPGLIDDRGVEITKCTTRTTIADFESDFNAPSSDNPHTLIASIQFTKGSSSKLTEAHVYLVDASNPNSHVDLASNQFPIFLNKANSHNNYDLFASVTSGSANAHYLVRACFDSAGNDATYAQAKLTGFENVSEVKFVDGAALTVAKDADDAVIASATTDFTVGNNLDNVVLASVQLYNDGTELLDLPAGSLRLVKDTAGTITDLDSNLLKFNFGRGANPDAQGNKKSAQNEGAKALHVLLMGEDKSAASASTYKVLLDNVAIDDSNGGPTDDDELGSSVQAEAKILVLQPSKVDYKKNSNAWSATSDKSGENKIGDAFSFESFGTGTGLVILAHANFDDTDSGSEKLDNLMLYEGTDIGTSSDTRIITQTSVPDDGDANTIDSFPLQSQGGASAGSNFAQTLLWKIHFLEEPAPEFQLAVDRANNAGGLIAHTKIMAFTTINEGREPGPEIVSFVGADPVTSDSGYSKDDTLTIKFNEPTNRPKAGDKKEIDNLLSFSDSIGKDYIGSWRSDTTLVITILDTTGNGVKFTPLGGSTNTDATTVTIKSSGKLRDQSQSSLISTDTSPRLVADFVNAAGPLITSITANDPDGGTDTGFSSGDTITVRFSEDTNRAGYTLTQTLNEDQVSGLFFFAQNSKEIAFKSATSGEDMYGKWINDKEFKITITNTGSANPLVGAMTMSMQTGSGLKNAAGTSAESTSISPPLSGTWGISLGPKIILLEASDPDGSTQSGDYGDGDVITAVFSENTNMKPVGKINTVLDKDDVDSLFTYNNDDGVDVTTATLGTNANAYSAVWTDAKTLVITIDNSTGGNPKLEQFTLTIKSSAGLKNKDETSLSSSSKSVLLSGTFGQPTGPELGIIEAADAKDTPVSGFNAGDTITVNFLEATNRPNAAKTADINSMFTFSQSIGDDYVGAWVNDKVFVITIRDAGSANPTIGTLTVTAKGDCTGCIPILNKDSTSKASTSTSLALIGNFGVKEGPLITSLIADDPDGVKSGESLGYNEGDTITVRFSEPTNLAGFKLDDSLDKDDVDSIFRMSQEIGDDYSGDWVTDRKFVVTIKDDSVDSPPEIGTLRFIVKESANLKDDGKTSSASDSVSPTLTGTFGEKEGPVIISLVAADPLHLTTSGYGNKDTITVQFSETTNRADFSDAELPKSDVDSIFKFSHSLGDDYTGKWITPSKFEITIKDSSNSAPPAVGTFSLSVKLSAGLQDESESSLISTATSPLLSGTFGAAPSPSIFSVQVADPDAGVQVGNYGNGDEFTILFDIATNGTNNDGGNVTKSYLDSLFDYQNYDGSVSSASLGNDYVGTWVTPFELKITILDSTGGDPTIGEFRLNVKDSQIKLTNAQETSEPLSGVSPLLSGSFTKKAGPSIISVIADDPDNSDDSYSVGDTITVEFSDPTNTPLYDETAAAKDSRLDGLGADTEPTFAEQLEIIDNEERTLTKSEVDSLFQFTQELGDDYRGFWDDGSTFVITILDDDVDVPPEVGSLQVIARESGNIVSDDSLASTSISPPLEGSFGTFQNILSMSEGGKGYTKLPAGMSASIQLPEDNSGTMTFTRVGADGETLPGKGVVSAVIGVSVDIEPSDGANCANGCPVSFEFTTADATAMGLSPNEVVILHDLNGDGDFGDEYFDANNNIRWNETITPTITFLGDDRWRAEGTTNSNSKFALGTVNFVSVGDSYSSINTVNDSTFISLGNSDNGLGGTLRTIDLSDNIEPLVFKTDETLVFRVGVYERQGINHIQHAGLYFNSVGGDLRTKDYDTSIVFDKYSEEIIKTTDPNGLLKHSEFKLLEKEDPTLLILQFAMTFDKSMDTSDLYFELWNEDRNPTYKTFNEILTIKPLDKPVSIEKPEEYIVVTSDDGEFGGMLPVDDSIPPWVKTYVQFWVKGEMSDDEFIDGIEYLITDELAALPANYVDSQRPDEIPKWVKDYARWWSTDKITDDDFIKAMTHLFRIGVINN